MTTLVVILIIISGVSKAVMDSLNHYYGNSIFFRFYNDLYWNPSISWKNKYKNYPDDKSPKFFLSTTLFVMFTDAWHLFQFFAYKSLFLAMFFLYLDLGTEKNIIMVLSLIILHQFSFHVCYENFFKLNKD